MSVTLTAERILDLYWDRSVPVNIDDIAQRMGAEVRYLPKLDGGDDISGRFDILNGRPICSVRSADPIVRQRFTLAHELGHYVLNHGGGFRDNAASFNVYNYDQREVDANKFAAEVLMPKLAIDYVIEKLGRDDVADLAQLFNVSQQAMRFRLKNLGWL